VRNAFYYQEPYTYADRGPSDEDEGRNFALLLQETRKVSYTCLSLPFNATLKLSPTPDPKRTL